MKKFLFIILFCLFILPVKANSINDIKMDIYIDGYGDAYVKEVWSVYLNDGTEGYKPYYNLGSSKIEDFKVTDDRGNTWTYSETWDFKTFEEKRYRNSIKEITNGIELCWGISNYGNNVYTLEYKITNFVINLEDAQMVYWTLVPYELSTKPGNVSIKIHADHAFADTLDVWGFGNKGGFSYVSDGYITLDSRGTLKSDEYMTVLVKFPLETFQTRIEDSHDFEHYLNMAEEGSSKYNNILDTMLDFVLDSIWFIIVLAISIISVIFGAKNKGYKLKLDYGKYPSNFSKDINYFRELPCEKDIFMAYFVAVHFNLVKNETDFLGAILLKWLKSNDIQIKKNGNKSDIIFNGELKEGIELEKKLYNWMLTASGDKILESKEFERWCSRNYRKILNWFKEIIRYEKDVLVEKGYLGLNEKNKYQVTSKLYEEALHLAGLKKYLNEFSSISDKTAIEVNLWQEYLMFAQIFGIADEVSKEFKRLYPEVITEETYNDIIIIRTVSYGAVRSAKTALSKAQSYSSGGGGFSSGGGGGGSFGGGGGGGGFR